MSSIDGTVLEPGQLVLVRRRPAIIRQSSRTAASDTTDVLNVVDIEYIDGWGYPTEDRVVWEREVGTKILSSLSLPRIEDPSKNPDLPERFDAFLNAIRWTSHGGILETAENIISPWQSAVQIEDYQLYPVLKAMAMPRVSLLLADDVGLGKTIEAGLITSELISKRRIRRILIVCPASLRVQWKEEMKEKFNLDFAIMDSAEAFAIQRKFGMDTNPWRMSPRIITSMDYLRQQDVLERFSSAFEEGYSRGLAALPWDLLIVDEAHNFTPSGHRDESLRCRMLRDITKYFEHRLFLTATPHNGYTVSFSGLLELLDPLRFQQKSQLDERDQSQVQYVMVRRLKSELNRLRAEPRFPERHVGAIPIESMSEEELQLFSALREYRTSGLKIVSKGEKNEYYLGRFLFSLLTKRLLSSTYAFAQTWWNHVGGFELEEFGFEEANNSQRKVVETIANDEEKKRLEDDAIRYGGGWLNKYRSELRYHLDSVSLALEALGWTREAIEKGIDDAKRLPSDAKWDALLAWIKDNLVEGGRFKDDERLIVFTEYRDTQEYILRRLREEGFGTEQVRYFFGGMDESSRSLIKNDFNDPGSPTRILVATDAASEGLNLQMSCRYVVHQEIPWNPARLEQRNGRVDRHGQSRDVYVYHFVSQQDEDQKFLDFVARKVNRVREDLGSAGMVLDEAVLEHFSGHSITEKELDRRLNIDETVSPEKQDVSSRDSGREEAYRETIQRLRATELRLGLTPSNLAGLLDQAVRMDGGLIEETETEGVFGFSKVPVGWKALVESSLCIQKGDARGAIPRFTFDPSQLEVREFGRTVFRPRQDRAFLRLGHPLMKRCLSLFRRRLWDDAVPHPMKRWTIVSAPLPGDMDIVACVYCIISARNNLGEVLHSRVEEVPVQLTGTGGAPIIEELRMQIPLNEGKALPPDGLERWIPRVREHWIKSRDLIEETMERLRTDTEREFTERLVTEMEQSRASEEEAFSRRLEELDTEKNPKNIERLRKDMQRAEDLAIQRTFYSYLNREHQNKRDELRVALADAEWERQHSQIVLLKRRLEAERERVLERVIPDRYSLSSVDVWPVAVRFVVRGG